MLERKTRRKEDSRRQTYLGVFEVILESLGRRTREEIRSELAQKRQGRKKTGARLSLLLHHLKLELGRVGFAFELLVLHLKVLNGLLEGGKFAAKQRGG